MFPGAFIVDRDLHRLIQERVIIIHSVDNSMPFDPSTQIAAGSVDLRLHNVLRRYKQEVDVIDLSAEPITELFSVAAHEDIEIKPGELLLATTLELVILPANIGGLITGRSSVARRGLMVQISQDFVHPGHSQLIPLQLANATDRPIRLKPFLPICQLALFYTTSRAEKPYGSSAGDEYKDELTSPFLPKVIEESGSEKPSRPAQRRDSLRHQQIQQQVEGFRRETEEASAREEQRAKQATQNKLTGILALVYIVIGACLSMFIYELETTPFPSLRLIVSSVLLLFCVAIIIIGYWRK